MPCSRQQLFPGGETTKWRHREFFAGGDESGEDEIPDPLELDERMFTTSCS
jgi:hypothetical protein